MFLEQITDTLLYIVSRPKLVLTLVVLPVWIPVATYRLAIATFTGHLSLRPLRSNIDYSIKQQPKRFIYYYFVLLFVTSLMMLGLWATVDIVINQPT